MAEKIKLLITKDTAIGGKYVERGTVIEVDPEVAADKNAYGLLQHAGVVAEATKKNVDRLQAEIDRDKKHLAAHAKAEPSTPETIAAAAAKAVVETLIEHGLIKAK
jgi:hypothetical protein